KYLVDDHDDRKFAVFFIGHGTVCRYLAVRNRYFHLANDQAFIVSLDNGLSLYRQDRGSKSSGRKDRRNNKFAPVKHRRERIGINYVLTHTLSKKTDVMIRFYF